MSKNASLIINIVLVIAVAILYFLQFNSSSSGSIVDEEIVEDSASTGHKVQAGSEIYYINTDTISLKYEFAIELDKKLKNKREQSRNKLENAIEKFKKDVQSFQETSRFMSPEEGKKKESELRYREGELGQLEKELSEQLMEDQEKLNRDLRKRILDYIKKDGETRKFNFVMGYSEMENNILVASDSLDITNEILKGLNEEYKLSLETQK